MTERDKVLKAAKANKSDELWDTYKYLKNTGYSSHEEKKKRI